MDIVLVTGGFDPLHSGHIAYFKAARKLGDRLVVGLNSDQWLTRKKGRPFMKWRERASVIQELSCVDEVIRFNDKDDSAVDAILKCKKLYPKDEIIFANGGDRGAKNIPELFDDRTGELRYVYGVGGFDKKNSSSWILKDWRAPQTKRAWGKYRVLDTNGHWRVKELTIDVDKSLSDQRHFIRSEHWHIVDGDLEMILQYPGEDWTTTEVLTTGDSVDIPVETWHKAVNVGKKPVKVIEVWMGSKLSEDDIERRAL